MCGYGYVSLDRRNGKVTRAARTRASAPGLWMRFPLTSRLFVRSHVLDFLSFTCTSFLLPTKLQQDALPFLVNGRDVIIDAPARSGKTTTTCISILQRVDTSDRQCQALVLAPFPKAALRTQKVILALGGYDLQCHACIDHAELREDSVRLGEGPPIVIGTPTYVQGIIRYGVLATDDIRLFVLDGVDEMLSEGLESVLREFFQYIPRNAQVVFLLSNTSMELKGIAKKFLRDPVSVVHGHEEPLPDDCEAVSRSPHGFEVKLCEIEVRH